MYHVQAVSIFNGGNIIPVNRSASFKVKTQWLKVIPLHDCVHLKLGHHFHALLKVCSDHDDNSLFKISVN